MTKIEGRRRRKSITPEATMDAVSCKLDLDGVICALEQIKDVCVVACARSQ
jgi:hypothetical protein